MVMDGGRWDRMAVVEGEVSCSGGRKEGRMEGESRLWDGAFREQYQCRAVPDRRSPMESYREAV